MRRLFIQKHPDGICAAISARLKQNHGQGYCEFVDINNDDDFIEIEEIWKDMCKIEDIDGIPRIEYGGI